MNICDTIPMGSSTVEGKQHLDLSTDGIHIHSSQASLDLHMVTSPLPRVREVSWWWRLPLARLPTPHLLRRRHGWRKASLRKTKQGRNTERLSSAKVSLWGGARGTGEPMSQECLAWPNMASGGRWYNLETHGLKNSGSRDPRWKQVLKNNKSHYFSCRLTPLFQYHSLTLTTSHLHLWVGESPRWF